MNATIRLLFAGDFCSSTPEKIELSKEISGIFKESDLNILNLEGPLEAGKRCSANKSVLKQSKNSSLWCRKNGFNIVSIANNHSFDYGEAGIDETLKNTKVNNVKAIGAGFWEDAYKIETIIIKGKRIGFYAASSCDMATLKDKRYDKDKKGCAWINHPDTRRAIINGKRECDYLFIIPHAGVEYMDIPLPEWRDAYKELIDLGADGIFSSHPHVPQGIEVYKSRPIFYSLGNFFFEGSSSSMQHKHKFWNTGLIALVNITENEISFNYAVTKRDGYYLSIEKEESIINHIHEIIDDLNNDDRYYKRLEVDIEKFHKKYKTWLLQGMNACEITSTIGNFYYVMKQFFKGKSNDMVALHQLRDENSRWTIQRALKLKHKALL